MNRLFAYKLHLPLLLVLLITGLVVGCGGAEESTTAPAPTQASAADGTPVSAPTTAAASVPPASRRPRLGREADGCGRRLGAQTC